ncbi:MAG TPA: VOC family protein [Candidatus Limnocylindrales bacterium]|nr:VOC family protein [Candidatus Limnocylindrales bacterium]
MQFRIEVVVVPVSDVDRAKAFYADQCGFPVDLDVTPGPAMRVVQLTPVGSGCSLVLGTGVTLMEPGSLKGVQICVADVDAARAHLADRGVPVTPVQHHDGSGFVDGRGDNWNSWCFFDDPDGNSWAIQESPTMRAAAAG